MEVVGVTQSAFQHLRDQIITGQLEPGQKLGEVQLADSLGISRPPLREAFRLLERDHLVTRVPRKGTFVTPLSPRDLEEVYAARRMIEGHVVEVLASRKERRLPALRQALAETAQASLPSTRDSQDILDVWRTFTSFHLRLVEACHSSLLNQLYHVVSEKLSRYQVLYLKIPGTWIESQQDHQLILELLEAGAHVKARKALLDHLTRTMAALRPRIVEQGLA